MNWLKRNWKKILTGFVVLLVILSPHSADQFPLMANRQLKPVWFAEANIRAHLEREYVPGEEK